MNRTVSKIIQQKRRAKGLTQERLAQLVGVSSAAVSKWETASAMPDVALLCPLARALDCTVNELLDFKPQLTMEEIETASKTAQKYFEQGQWQKALEFCEGRLQEYPNDLELCYQFSALYMKYLAVSGSEEQAQKQLQRAIQLMEQVQEIEDEEKQREVLLMLSGMYTVANDYDRALETLEKLPGCNQEARTMRASILMQKGDLQAAETLETANLINHAANTQMCLMGLANIEAKKNDVEKAMHLLDQIDILTELFTEQNLSNGMSSMAAIQRIGLLCRKEEWEKAAEQVQRYVDYSLQTAQRMGTAEAITTGAFWLKNALQVLENEELPTQVLSQPCCQEALQRLKQAEQQEQKQAEK